MYPFNPMLKTDQSETCLGRSPPYIFFFSTRYGYNICICIQLSQHIIISRYNIQGNIKNTLLERSESVKVLIEVWKCYLVKPDTHKLRLKWEPAAGGVEVWSRHSFWWKAAKMWNQHTYDCPVNNNIFLVVYSVVNLSGDCILNSSGSYSTSRLAICDFFSPNAAC